MKSVSGFATVLLLTAAFGMTSSAVFAQPAASASKPAGGAAPAMAMAAKPGAPAIVRTEILRTPLEGLPAFDGIMYVTDIPAGLAAPRHYHPGYEFNYILKGSISFQIDGQKPYTLHAGQATYNVRNHIHRVWNASATEPAQLVAVLINEHGKPLAIPADPVKPAH